MPQDHVDDADDVEDIDRTVIVAVGPLARRPGKHIGVDDVIYHGQCIQNIDATFTIDIAPFDMTLIGIEDIRTVVLLTGTGAITRIPETVTV